VNVLLGLYGFTLLSSHNDDTGLLLLLEMHKSRVFPKDYFGDLVDILEEQVETGRMLFSPTPTLPTLSRGSVSTACEFTKEDYEQAILVQKGIRATSTLLRMDSGEISRI